MEKESKAPSVTEAICSAAVKASLDLSASLVIALTETGHTARLVAKYRPRAPVLTITNQEAAARQALCSRGLFPLLVDSMLGTESLVNRAIIAAKKLGMCKVGDLVVCVQGTKEAVSGSTNHLNIVTVSW